MDDRDEGPITLSFARFLEEPEVEQSRGIVIGAWRGDVSDAGSRSIVEALTRRWYREALVRLSLLPQVGPGWKRRVP